MGDRAGDGDAPRRGVVEIDFASGADGLAPIPYVVARAGLAHRFAVIQRTAVAGSPAMVFDTALWRTLLAFVTRQPGRVTVLSRFADLREVPLDADGLARMAEDGEGVDPPWALLRRDGGRLDLAMVTDDWAAVGGPAPYHDSLTYSFYAGRDVGAEVKAWLEARRADHWRLGSVQAAPQKTTRRPRVAPGSLRRLLWLSLFGQP